MTSAALPEQMTVLYIDDERLVREALSAYLDRVGFQVFQAKNGSEGLGKLPLLQPSVVLVDLKMPGMSGLEVLERITAESPDTPAFES